MMMTSRTPSWPMLLLAVGFLDGTNGALGLGCAGLRLAALILVNVSDAKESPAAPAPVGPVLGAVSEERAERRAAVRAMPHDQLLARHGGQSKGAGGGSAETLFQRPPVSW